MADTANPKEEFSIDSWVGNPDMITEVEEDLGTQTQPTRFHSLNLTKRIFFSALVALSIFLIGVVIVFQSQNKSVQLLRTSLTAQADYFASKFEAIAQNESGSFDLSAITQEMTAHDFYKLAIYDENGALIHQTTFEERANPTQQSNGWFRFNKLTALGASTRASLGDVMTLTLSKSARGDQSVQTYEIFGENVVFATDRFWFF